MLRYILKFILVLLISFADVRWDVFNKTSEKRFALSCFLSPVEGKWLNILGQQGGGCKVNGGIGKNFRIGGGGEKF